MNRPSRDEASRRPERDGAPSPSSNNQKPTFRPYQPIPSAKSAPKSSGRPPSAPPPRPGKLFTPPPEAPRGRPVRPPRPRRSGSGLKFGLLYIGLIGLVVVTWLGLFAATRVFGFLNSISVERQDANGNIITGSNVTGRGRVNIALLGVDRRPDEVDGSRSDTILILSIDQDNKAVNMLSIPRDLWVKIPGKGDNRISSAYFFGDQEKKGTGGPRLVKQTIQANFGIQIDYFIEVDFNGFRTIIDAIGGITIDVKKPLIDSEYPTEDYGIKRIFIPAGLQRLDGQTALEYARSRHSDSDFGRNQRQQEVILAIREQGLNLGVLTNTQLQAALQGAIKTDLSAGDIVALGQLALGMKRENIRQFAIDSNITRQQFINGADVLVPDQAAFNQLIQQFLSTNPTNPPPG